MISTHAVSASLIGAGPYTRPLAISTPTTTASAIERMDNASVIAALGSANSRQAWDVALKRYEAGKFNSAEIGAIIDQVIADLAKGGALAMWPSNSGDFLAMAMERGQRIEVRVPSSTAQGSVLPWLVRVVGLQQGTAFLAIPGWGACKSSGG